MHWSKSEVSWFSSIILSSASCVTEDKILNFMISKAPSQLYQARSTGTDRDWGICSRYSPRCRGSSKRRKPRSHRTSITMLNISPWTAQLDFLRQPSFPSSSLSPDYPLTHSNYALALTTHKSALMSDSNYLLPTPFSGFHPALTLLELSVKCDSTSFLFIYLLSPYFILSREWTFLPLNVWTVNTFCLRFCITSAKIYL